MITIKNFNSLPAQFIVDSVESSEDSLYTRAKLKVFYVGMTADKRFFSEDFAQKLIKSAAYTPVISYFDSEKDDFEGHASEQQVYGVVDPMVAPTFETDENGTKWAILDVILFTQRPDSVGEIASKIIGHPQSLEMDANSLKYKIKRNRCGDFECIEFVDAKFTGVSVLGYDQEPAFTGSSFFSVMNDFATDFRGNEMTIQIQEFAKLAWSEKSGIVVDALVAKYQENFWFVADMYDKYVVYYAYNPEEGKVYLYKADYKIIENDTAELGEPVRVHPSYEEYQVQVEAPIIEPAANTGDGNNADDVSTDEHPASFVEEPQPTPNVVEEPQPIVEPEPEPVTNSEPVVDSEPVTDSDPVVDPEPSFASNEDPIPEPTPAPGKDTNEGSEENQTGSTILSSAELQELQEYRRKEKIALIASYSDTIEEKELDALRNSVDEYTKEELTNKLNALFVTYSRRNTPIKNKIKWTPSPSNEGKNAATNDVAEYIRNMRY